MNSVVLVGRLAADPEIRYANTGTTCASFRVAVNRKYKKEGQPDADFITCKAFGKTADLLEKYFSKGMKIGLTGSIQTGSYKNKDGQTVYTTDIMCDSVEFVESKQQTQQPVQDPAPGTFMDIPDDIGEELPFA